MQSAPIADVTAEKVTYEETGSGSGSQREAGEDVVPASTNGTAVEETTLDPMEFERRKRDNVTSKQMKADYPSGNKRKLKKYYTRQNELIDEFLGAGDEERLHVAEMVKMGPRIKIAVNGSFAVNFCLFVIQLYAAVTTGSLSVRWPWARRNPGVISYSMLTRRPRPSCSQQQPMPL